MASTKNKTLLPRFAVDRAACLRAHKAARASKTGIDSLRPHRRAHAQLQDPSKMLPPTSGKSGMAESWAVLSEAREPIPERAAIWE